MFNIDDFRVKDLDELVPLVKPEDTEYSVRKYPHSHFVLGKKCSAAVKYDKKTDALKLYLSGRFMKESFSYGGKSKIAIDSVDYATLLETFLVFDYVVNEIRKPDAMITHKLLSNIEKLVVGEPAPYIVSEIVDEKTYAKAIEKAKKAFNKEQEATIESQTPVYDT